MSPPASPNAERASAIERSSVARENDNRLRFGIGAVLAVSLADDFLVVRRNALASVPAAQTTIMSQMRLQYIDY